MQVLIHFLLPLVAIYPFYLFFMYRRSDIISRFPTPANLQQQSGALGNVNKLDLEAELNLLATTLIQSEWLPWQPTNRVSFDQSETYHSGVLHVPFLSSFFTFHNPVRMVFSYRLCRYPLNYCLETCWSQNAVEVLFVHQHHVRLADDCLCLHVKVDKYWLKLEICCCFFKVNFPILCYHVLTFQSYFCVVVIHLDWVKRIKRVDSTVS